MHDGHHVVVRCRGRSGLDVGDLVRCFGVTCLRFVSHPGVIARGAFNCVAIPARGGDSPRMDVSGGDPTARCPSGSRAGWARLNGGRIRGPGGPPPLVFPRVPHGTLTSFARGTLARAGPNPGPRAAAGRPGDARRLSSQFHQDPWSRGGALPPRRGRPDAPADGPALSARRADASRTYGCRDLVYHCPPVYTQMLASHPDQKLSLKCIRCRQDSCESDLHVAIVKFRLDNF
jgi:hypothetical protein